MSTTTTDKATERLEALTVDPSYHVTGNVTRDPELAFSGSGVAVTKFAVALNSRKKVGDEWVDGEPTFIDVVCFNQLAENVATSVAKGTRIHAAGKLQLRRWYHKDGEVVTSIVRSALELVANEVDVTLRWATAEVTKAARTNGRGPSADEYAADEGF